MPVLLAVLLPGNVISQHQPYFINTTEADGLSDNHIHSFLKDKTGYMWIATANGLNRFDGINFKIYKPSVYKKNYLSNGFVTAVKQDNNADIWAATKKGLNRIDALTDTTEVLNVVNEQYKINLPKESVWDVLPDGDAVWIVIDTKPLIYYNTKTKQSRYYNFKKFLADNQIEYTTIYHSIFKIVPDGKNGLWLATTDGIFHFDKHTGNFELAAGMALDEITFFDYEATVGKLYCADERKIIYTYDVADKKLSSIAADAAKYHHKYLLPYQKIDNQLFVPVPEGLVLLNSKDEIAAFLQANDSKDNTIISGKLNTVYKDRDGITWIGADNGVTRFVPQLNNSLHVSFPKKLLFDDEFSLKNIFYQPQNNQWLVASYADNKIWKVDNSTAAISELIKPSNYKNDVGYAFYSNHPDTIFILCDGSLVLYLPQKNKWSKINLPSPWNIGTVTCMAIDAAGNYWLGTRRKGLIVYNVLTKKVWTPYKDIKEANIIHALEYDKASNCMWIASYSTGLHQYNFADGSLKHIQRDDADNNAMHASLINDLALDGRNIWAATMEGGLAKCRWSAGEKKVVSYDITNGLPDNIVFSVAAAEENIFFGTAKGIGVIGADGKIKTFLNNHTGLPFSSFQQSIATLSQGYIATAVDKQLYSFSTKSILQPGNAAILIDQIILNDSILTKSSQSSFRHNQNSFQFHFAALDFISPQATEYFYMLQGFDKNWISNGYRHSIRYANLPPGKYSFKVKAKMANGKILQQQAVWDFTVLPPFWQTWWFVLLLCLFIAAVILYSVKQRIKLIRREEQVKSGYEKRIAETEMHALRAQMNPHFMFNSLNSINNFILKNDPENASGYLTKFSRLMRLILDNSRSEWVLLENELKALELYIEMEALRFDNAFTWHIEITEDTATQTMMVPPMIIQPYTENAIWHGLLHRAEKGGRLDIRLWKNNTTLYIEIEDNGIGREEAGNRKSKSATTHKSHGMQITAERMEMVNRIYNVNAGVTITDLKNGSAHPAGTRVLLSLEYKIHDEK